MDPVNQAQQYFLEGYQCSQAVILAYAPRFELERETSARLAAPFGGGIARRGETCGAVNGAFMVLGLTYGHHAAGDDESKERTYQAVQEFISRFKARNGSTQCSQLLGLDISDPEKLLEARARQLFTITCPAFVADAARILDQLLAEA